MMRTTLNLPKDVYDVARSLAAAKHLSLGEAVAELVRKGLRPEIRIRSDSPFPCFAVPEGAAPITLEHSLETEDQP